MEYKNSLYTFDEVLVKLQQGVDVDILATLCGYNRTRDFVVFLHKKGYDSNGQRIFRQPPKDSWYYTDKTKKLSEVELGYIRDKVKAGWTDYVITNNLNDFDKDEVTKICIKVRRELKAESNKTIKIEKGSGLIAIN